MQTCDVCGFTCATMDELIQHCIEQSWNGDDDDDDETVHGK
jgi:hypothetical protein